jgi:cytochrome c
MKVALFAAVLVAFSGLASAAEPAAAKACMGCHQVDKKVFGPMFKDVANKYKGDAKAEEHIVSVINNGSKGVWGTFAMPKQDIKPDDAKAIAKWIMSL